MLQGTHREEASFIWQGAGPAQRPPQREPFTPAEADVRWEPPGLCTLYVSIQFRPSAFPGRPPCVSLAPSWGERKRQGSTCSREAWGLPRASQLGL